MKAVREERRGGGVPGGAGVDGSGPARTCSPLGPVFESPNPESLAPLLVEAYSYFFTGPCPPMAGLHRGEQPTASLQPTSKYYQLLH